MKRLLWILYLCFLCSIVVAFFCSRAPVDPEPCDPVPCDPVPCDIVDVEVVYEIFYPEDRSPNNIILLKNDEVIFSLITERFNGGVREIRHSFLGTYKPGDSLKGSAKGSESYIRFAFHANE